MAAVRKSRLGDGIVQFVESLRFTHNHLIREIGNLDSSASIGLTMSGALSKRSRAYRTRDLQIRQKCADDKRLQPFLVRKVDGTSTPADGYTKPLSRGEYESFCDAVDVLLVRGPDKEDYLNFEAIIKLAGEKFLTCVPAEVRIREGQHK